MTTKYSEKELITNTKEEIFNIKKYIVHNFDDLKLFSDRLPYWIHVNNRNNFFLSFVSEKLTEQLDVDFNHIDEFMQKRIHPESTAKVIPLLTNFVRKGKYGDILVFEQKINLKREHPERFKNFLSFTSDSGLYEDLITLTFPQEQIEKVVQSRIFSSNPTFIKYYDRFNQLTEREKQILAGIAEGKTNKEIADELYISRNTIKTHRQNIIKKLDTNKIADLVRIAIFFELV